MFAEVLGRDSELCGGRGGSAHLMAPAYGFLGENSIVGAGVPMALGAALARSFEPRPRPGVAVVSIGDGAMNQGNVHESLNMAAVLKLPLLVIVENNGYAEMTPADALTAVPRPRSAPPPTGSRGSWWTATTPVQSPPQSAHRPGRQSSNAPGPCLSRR